MKKLYALLMAGVMTVSLAMPVGAQGSVTASAPDPAPVQVSEAAAASMKAAETVKVSVSNVGLSVADEYMTEEAVRVAADAQVLRDLNVASAARPKAVVNVSYSGTIPAGGVQIPFDVSGFAKKGDLVYVLHRVENDDRHPWEVVGQAVLGDSLTVTGTFTSFSPVVFMVVDSAQVAATGVKAPKTGE